MLLCCVVAPDAFAYVGLRGLKHVNEFKGFLEACLHCKNSWVIKTLPRDSQEFGDYTMVGRTEERELVHVGPANANDLVDVRLIMKPVLAQRILIGW